MNVIGSYTQDEPILPWQNNIILQKKVSGVDKVVNFKDFLRPIEEVRQVLFKDLNRIQGFSRRLVKFKTFSRLYEPWVRRLI